MKITYFTGGLQLWGVVFLCLNAMCHLFCRFHYVSKKKTSARSRAQMFSRSNYPLNYPLKAIRGGRSPQPRLVLSPSSIIQDTAANITSHEEEERGAARGEMRRWRNNTQGFSVDSVVFYLMERLCCHMSVHFRRENDSDSFMLQMKNMSQEKIHATSAIL